MPAGVQYPRMETACDPTVPHCLHTHTHTQTHSASAFLLLLLLFCFSFTLLLLFLQLICYFFCSSWRGRRITILHIKVIQRSALPLSNRLAKTLRCRLLDKMSGVRYPQLIFFPSFPILKSLIIHEVQNVNCGKRAR